MLSIFIFNFLLDLSTFTANFAILLIYNNIPEVNNVEEAFTK